MEKYFLIGWMASGIVAVIFALITRRYIYKKPVTEEIAIELFHNMFDLIFAMSLIVAVVFNFEGLFRSGELNAPMLLGGLSLVLRAWFRISNISKK